MPRTTKTQQAMEIIRQAAREGKTCREVESLVEQATGLCVFCEGPLTEKTAGKAYYNSHNREEKRAIVQLFARRSNGGFGRRLAREFVGGIKS